MLLPATTEAREPHRPPERGTFFIPFERIGFGSEEEEAADDADADMQAYALVGPAEAALSGIDDADAIADALRALLVLDAQRLGEVPDMAVALAAHLPRYRLADGAVLHAAPEGEAIARLPDGHLLILMALRDGWREVYDARAHRIGWVPRSVNAGAESAGEAQPRSD